MDLHAPTKNRNKTAGFCDAERDGFAALLREGGLADAWREAHPEQQQFTYWSSRFNCRANNKGWRLDYILTDASVKSRVRVSARRGSELGAAACLPAPRLTPPRPPSPPAAGSTPPCAPPGPSAPTTCPSSPSSSWREGDAAARRRGGAGAEGPGKATNFYVPGMRKRRRFVHNGLQRRVTTAVVIKRPTVQSFGLVQSFSLGFPSAECA